MRTRPYWFVCCVALRALMLTRGCLDFVKSGQRLPAPALLVCLAYCMLLKGQDTKAARQSSGEDWRSALGTLGAVLGTGLATRADARGVE